MRLKYLVAGAFVSFTVASGIAYADPVDPVILELTGQESGTVTFTGSDASMLAPFIGQTVFAYEGGGFQTGPQSDSAVIGGTAAAVTVAWTSDPGTDLSPAEMPGELFFTSTGTPVPLHIASQADAVPTPEPASLALLGSALAGLGLLGRRRRRAA